MICGVERAAITAALVILTAGSGLQAAAAPFPPARPLVPFVPEGDIGCYWTMHAKGTEKWIRGGIGMGDDDPMIDFVDRAFYDWSDSEDHLIEVSVGDPNRRLPAKAWAGNAGGQTPGSAAFYMNAEMRKLIGGATSLQIWKDGKPMFNTLLANTPSAAELDACVRPPSDPEHTDEE